MEFKATGSITEDGSVGPPLHHMMEIVDGEDVIKDMSDGLSDLRLIISTFSLTVFLPVVAYPRRIACDYTKYGIFWRIISPRTITSHISIHLSNSGTHISMVKISFSDGTSPPRLIGVIDWDHAHAAPLCFLYEYPIFTQDVDNSKHLRYEENAILRSHFARAIRKQDSAGSACYLEAWACIPSAALNNFKDIFMNRVLWINEMIQAHLGQGLFGATGAMCCRLCVDSRDWKGIRWSG